MSTRIVPRWLLLIVVALVSARTMMAQAGRISGVVTDSSAARPLSGVEVVVLTASGLVQSTARSDEAGRYAITNVAPGSVRVRARALGFAPKDRVVNVAAGASVTVDFALGQRAAQQLDQVVVTGTGGAVERRAVGNVIESINADSILSIAAPRSVEQLIGARTPGVIVLPATGQVGTGAQLRVRSVGSLSLGTDPMVYIDGVRMDADPSRGPAQRGSAGASRLNDINPEDIESIEIIKGPAAATLYGTEASNGVVQIITKRGRTGSSRWNFSTRQGSNWLQNPEGRSGELYGKDSTGALTSFNLYQYSEENGGPIFTTGRNQGYSLDLNGGTDITRYYLSSSFDHDIGVVPWNWEKKGGGRANIDVQPVTTLHLAGSIGFIRDRIRLAQPGEINPDPFSNLVWGRPGNIATTGGFGFAPRALWDDVENHADNDRTTTSLTANYEPVRWFTQRLTAGLDVSSESNWTLYPRETAENAGFYGSNGLGAKSVERVSRSFLTLDYLANLKYALGASAEFTTTFGLQHYRSEVNGITATGTTFPASPITVVSGSTTRSGSEAYSANATLGMYVQEQFAWKNRFFLTGAVRGDDNSAFGKNYSAAYYPKVSGSWVVSDEPFWGTHLGAVTRFVDNLRLRGAFGAAGTQPGTFDAARLYGPSIGYLNQPGLVPSAFGNPQLKPERSTELELGFETAFLQDRLNITYTHFGRKVTDAIVNVPLPPSSGYPGNQVINIGKVSAWGNEFSANMQMLRGRRVSWELGTQLANNGNRIDDLGGQQFLTVGGGGVAQNRVGFGIADFFMYKVRSATLDANGVPTAAVCDGGTGKAGLEMGGADVPCPLPGATGTTAPRVLWGHSQPTWQAGVNTSVTLWENFRLYGRVDGNGGNLQTDTEIRALHNQGSTRAVIERNDPFLQTYRVIEADAPSTYKAGFLKLREVSATYTVPAKWASKARASGASVTLAGRNLSMLWSAQQGWNTSRDGEIYVDIANQHVWDPEIRAVGARSNGYQTIMPPTSSFVLSARLTY